MGSHNNDRAQDHLDAADCDKSQIRVTDTSIKSPNTPASLASFSSYVESSRETSFSTPYNTALTIARSQRHCTFEQRAPASASTNSFSVLESPSSPTLSLTASCSAQQQLVRGTLRGIACSTLVLRISGSGDWGSHVRRSDGTSGNLCASGKSRPPSTAGTDVQKREAFRRRVPTERSDFTHRSSAIARVKIALKYGTL